MFRRPAKHQQTAGKTTFVRWWSVAITELKAPCFSTYISCCWFSLRDNVDQLPSRLTSSRSLPSFTMDGDDEKTQMLKKAFAMFDQGKTGFIETNRVAAILNTMGQQFDSNELAITIEEADKNKTGKLSFEAFYSIAANFLEDEDDEAMQNELKEAFRLYDKEGNGYITTAVLREILAALDDKLTSDDLDGIIEEIDEDGSGTIDFDEFMEMMTG